MNKYSLLIFFNFLVVCCMHAQHWTIEGQIGIGTYKMKDLKTFQKQNASIAKVIQNFPPYLFFRSTFSVPPSIGWRTGIAYSYMSSGARNDYQDYSGQVRLDQSIHAHCIGWNNSYENKIKKINYSVNLQLSRSFSKLEIDQQFVINGQRISGELSKYKSGSFLADGLLKGVYSFERFQAGIFMGYCLDFKGDLKTDKGAVTQTITDWSGLRSGILLGYTL